MSTVSPCAPAATTHTLLYPRLEGALPDLLALSTGDYPLAMGWKLRIIRSVERPRHRDLILYAPNRVHLHIHVDAGRRHAEIADCECPVYCCDMRAGDELCPSLSRYLTELLGELAQGRGRAAAESIPSQPLAVAGSA